MGTDNGLPVTANADIVGPTGGFGWLLKLNNGAPHTIKLDFIEVSPDSPLMLSIAYPQVLALLSLLMLHGAAQVNIIHAKRRFLLFHLLTKFEILWVILIMLILMDCLLLELSKLLSLSSETQIGYFLTIALLENGDLGMRLIDFREMVSFFQECLMVLG